MACRWVETWGEQRGGPRAASPRAWPSLEDDIPAPGLGCLLRYRCFLQRDVVTLAGVPCGQPMYMLRVSVSPIPPAALPGATHGCCLCLCCVPCHISSQEQK